MRIVLVGPAVWLRGIGGIAAAGGGRGLGSFGASSVCAGAGHDDGVFVRGGGEVERLQGEGCGVVFVLAVAGRRG